ncbi:MAG TPA: MlaD family protein [Gemmatimonadales bacterium]
MAAWHPRRVGIFVVTGTALLVAGVMLLNQDSLFSQRYQFVAWFKGSVNGLGPSSPVKMKGIEIGRVTGVYLGLPGQTTFRQQDTAAGHGEGVAVPDRVPVLFEVDERLLGEAGVASRLSEPGRLAYLIELGLRAELKLESFVTGQQYVALDFRPETEAILLNDTGIQQLEIPTVAPPLQSVQEDIAAVAKQIREADIAGMANRLSSVMARIDTTLSEMDVGSVGDRLDRTLTRVEDALDAVQHLAATADSSVTPMRHSMTETSDRLRQSLDSLDAMTQTMRAAMDPNSPLSVRMAESFRELGEAANAMRRLAEYLERNPSTLVRGRAKEK